MKIVVAMDSFKGCLTADEACQAVIDGIKNTLPTCDCIALPLSDGGEGLIDILDLNKYKIETITVSGPIISKKVKAKVAINHKLNTAIIESAQACGLVLLETGERNPLLTSTHGVGEMISYAISSGCTKIIIGLGGSATNDAGAGMLHALGMKFFDKNQKEILPNGGNLGDVAKTSGFTELQDKLKNISFIAACDVNNPLYGSNGASRIYAPQKGASKEDVLKLDNNLRHFSKIVTMCTDSSKDNTPGAGAAGGLGYAILSFLSGQLCSGASIVLDLLNFNHFLSNADHVITGEGQSDSQTLMGKLPYVIMKKAQENGVKTSIISGKSTDGDELINAGFYSVNSATPSSMPLDIALRKEIAINNLKECAQNFVTRIS